MGFKKGEYNHSPNMRWILSLLARERKHPMNGISFKGRKHTKETKRKISNSEKGKIESAETRHKKSIAHSTPELKELHRKIRANQIFPSKDTKPEQMLQIALAVNEIKFEKHKQSIKGYPDLFIEPNICIFVDGDYFHANPKKYKANNIIQKKSMKLASDIWAYDTFINHELNNQGYTVIRVWASDILNNPNNCAKNIINLINSSVKLI